MTNYGISKGWTLTRTAAIVRSVDAAADLSRTSWARRMYRLGRAEDCRLRNHLSLSEWARVVGVTPTTILRYERGDRLPRLAIALRLATVLEELGCEGARPTGS